MWSNIEGITIDDVECIKEESIPEIERHIASKINRGTGYETKLKISIIVDSFVGVCVFGKQQSLGSAELLKLLQIQESLLIKCEENNNIDETMKWFIQNIYPEQKMEETSPDHLKYIKKVIDYFLQSFFQHFQLYSYVLIENSEILLTHKEVELEILPLISPFPAPLVESFEEILYEKYINVKEETTVVGEGSKVLPTDPEIEVNTENNDFLLSNIGLDQLKEIILETTDKKLLAAKAELEVKIREKESAMLKSMNKL